MGKQDRLDGSETTFTDTDPEKAPVGRHEQTLKSAGQHYGRRREGKVG